MPGIQKLKETLSSALDEGLLSHAILIEGEKGTGKRELALWLAEALLCQGQQPPCGGCSVCRKIADGNHPDVETILPEDKKTSIGIGSVRAIKESLWLAPSEASQKIYIIPDAQNLTIEAQNALLKSLEEPPSYARFLLTCENRRDLLDTIQSRVTVYSLEPPTRDECARELTRLYPDLSEKDASLLSLAVSGNLGAGKERMENGTFPLLSLAAETPALLRKGKTYDLLAALGKKTGDRTALSLYCDDLATLSGRCCVDRAAGKETPFLISPTEAVRLLAVLDRCREAIHQNCSAELIQSWMCAELSGIFGGNL